MKKIKTSKAFFIVMGFFIFIFIIFSVSKIAYSYNDIKANSEVVAIEKKIAELEDIKKGYKTAAIKHANKAERLQFVDGQLQVAKKHWRLSDENRKIVDKIQSQIDDLKLQKLKIQKK